MRGACLLYGPRALIIRNRVEQIHVVEEIRPVIAGIRRATQSAVKRIAPARNGVIACWRSRGRCADRREPVLCGCPVVLAALEDDRAGIASIDDDVIIGATAASLYDVACAVDNLVVFER